MDGRVRLDCPAGSTARRRRGAYSAAERGLLCSGDLFAFVGNNDQGTVIADGAGETPDRCSLTAHGIKQTQLATATVSLDAIRRAAPPAVNTDSVRRLSERETLVLAQVARG